MVETLSAQQDSLFKKIVVGSTGFGLACMLGSLAAIQISPGAGLEFKWHISILAIAAAGLFWNGRFWKLVWAAQQSPSPKSRRAVTVQLIILLLLGAGSFLYPIRFIEQSYWNGILRGLITAGGFLGVMIGLIYKCGQGLMQIDAIELERQSRGELQNR